jgi:hypothetical protein
LPNTLTIRLTGVKNMKYTIAITIGAITIPNISPNLIHNLFNGERIFELIKPKIKKIVEAIKKYEFILPPFFRGHKPIIKKTTKNKKPKLLLELLEFI